MKTGVRFFIAAALATAMPNALVVFAAPQKASKKAVAPAPVNCGHGVTVRLTSMATAQGSLLLATIQSAAPLAELKAEWAGHALPVWPDAKRKDLERALVGVDLVQNPGKYDLKLTARSPDGGAFSCNVNISVQEGKFAIEKLSVAKEFVEPSAEEAARAEKEGQHLHEIYSTVTPERLWAGKFRLPLDGARNAKNFGRRRVLNGQPRSPHSGMDLPAAAGTPIHAAQRGRVVLAEELFFGGNAVVVDHGLGVYTFYAHMQSIGVAVGDMVEKGALLGKVGATGRVTGPHLHWGLTIGDARVNPMQILALPLD
jgi:murein DD-endopeptidase MepM/ murein hydrolase activator NlpD